MRAGRIAALAAGVIVAVAGPVAAVAEAAPSPAPPVATQAADEPTLAELVRGLDAAYPPVRAAAQEVRAAEAALLAAEGAFDPAWRTRAGAVTSGPYPNQRVESGVEQPTPWWGAVLNGGWRLGTGSFAAYDGKAATNDAGELRAGVAVPLLRNGPIDRRRAELGRGEAGVVAARAALDQQRLEAARSVAAGYWEWVAAGRRLAVARDLLAVAERRDRDLAASVRSGQLAALERLDNERAIHQRRGGEVAAERALERAAIELSLFWRDAAGATRQPAGPPRQGLPPARPLAGEAVRADEAAAREARPEPRRLAAQRRQAEIERAWAENQLAPGLDLSLGASRDLGAGDPARLAPALEAGVAIDVPLVARTPRGRLAQAEAGVARLEDQRRFAADRAAADVRDAASAVEAARRQVEAAARELAVARRLEAAERERLALGEGTMFMVNLREQAAAEVAVREIDALAAYHRALAAYETAAGRLPR